MQTGLMLWFYNLLSAKLTEISHSTSLQGAEGRPGRPGPPGLPGKPVNISFDTLNTFLQIVYFYNLLIFWDTYANIEEYIDNYE